jgi:hypothetical protein
MSIEAMKQALQALESSRIFVTTREKIKHPETTEWYDDRITVLRQAIEAAEKQEPVAWMVYTQDGQSVYVTDNPTDIQELQQSLPLYTTPPQRKWVGLTEQEIDRLNFTQVGGCQCSFGYIEGIEEFAKSIEAKLREKNGC